MEEINDTEFKIIIPKYDNSGKKIKTEVIKEIGDKMSEHFKGISINPSIIGCWKDKGKMICEENLVISAIRDSETTENYGNQINNDVKFMKNLSKKVGKSLGQAEILQSKSKVEADFVKGKFKKGLPRKTGKNVFNII